MNQPSIIEDSNSVNDLSGPFGEFIKQFESLSCPEEKLRKGLLMMRTFIAQKENLPFKEFWEVRKLCIPLFKENIAPQARSQCWDEYIALTREGRELKNMLDEEATFAAEQIEIAIKALEEEVDLCQNAPEEAFAKNPSPTFPGQSRALERRYSFYIEKQRALNLLNVYAERINALRKELIKTPMRFRFKNKFFQRLSTLGDRIFPLRRDFIKELSFSFEEDVMVFVKEHFSPSVFSHEKVKRSVFFYREEIKTLQAIAKLLTLNTHAFTVTREELSKCWDLLKGMEKELKKEYSQQKHKSEENAALIRSEIEEVKKGILEGKCEEEILSQCEDILKKMRECELTRSDVFALKDEIRIAKEPIFAKREEEEKLRREKEIAFEEKRKREVEQFKAKVLELKERFQSNDNLESLSLHIEECVLQMQTVSLSKKEKVEAERILKRLSQEIAEKREEALLVLSDDDRKVLDNLIEILNQRKERKQEIKKQIDEYRKILGGSSLDIGKAIEYNELVSAEKERLEKIEEGIVEIEKKIRELKKR